MCPYPGSASHSSSVNLPSYIAEGCRRPEEPEEPAAAWLLCLVRCHSLGLSSKSEALWRNAPENHQRPSEQTLETGHAKSGGEGSRRAYPGCCSPRRTPNCPRSSRQNLYWAQRRSRAPRACCSSGSRSNLHPCRLKTRLLCPDADGHQTLGEGGGVVINEGTR